MNFSSFGRKFKQIWNIENFWITEFRINQVLLY
jgi:hypothetical protein